MKSSLQKLFERIELLYENTYNLMLGFQRAANGDGSIEDIQIPIKDENGNVTYITVNSFQHLQADIKRIDENFRSITNGDNLSYLLSADGSISTVLKTSFINAEYLSDFNISRNCLIDKTSVVDNLVFPNVKIPITIDSKIRSDVHAFVYEIIDGWDSIGDNPKMIDVEHLIETGDVIAKVYEHSLQLQKEQVRYFGKFAITSIEQKTENSWRITTDTLMYESLNAVGNSVQLKIGDVLVLSNGNAKFQIDELNTFTNTLTITRIAGVDIPVVGVGVVQYNEVLPSDTHIVGLPVKPAQQLVVFLSTENIKNISYPSVGLKIDTSVYNVVYNNTTYTLDEFFAQYVTNIGEYMQSLINETSIPISLGIVPNQPVLDSANFKVVQINKHLVTTQAQENLTKLNQEKQKIQNDIKTREDSIKVIQSELDTLTFKTIEEKQSRIQKITNYQNEIETLNNNLLVVTRNIDSNAVSYGLKDYKPKYRIVGFWEMQEPIFSPNTKAQQIIKYDVQYRYLSKNVDTVDTTSLRMVSGGREVNVVFSAWVDLATRTLNKVENNAGELVWETPVYDSVEDININQCLIPIRDGESVEIRVRAVSEAGYPIAPLKSEWSEILRIDFPENMSTSSVSALVAKNETDLQSSEFNQILQSAGLLKHISDQIKESEKLFFHTAKNIASGFYTAEMKNIDLQEFLQTIKTQLDTLTSSKENERVTVEVIDFNGDTFVCRDNTTLELFAGNYADTINLLDESKWGTIIRKTGYIRIKNANNIPVELRSIVPGMGTGDGTLSTDNAPYYYDTPVRGQEDYKQRTKQVVYFRNRDLTLQSDEQFAYVVKDPGTKTPVMPDSAWIDSSAPDADKNAYVWNGTSMQKVKIKPEADFTKFNCFATTYAGINAENAQQEFERLERYDKIIKDLSKQYSSFDGLEYARAGFADNDQYAIGYYTCGAYFYPVISNQTAISVNGDRTISTLIIPANSEILIPIVYEYRMTDALGHVNGKDKDINATLVYGKKMGIDILIDNSVFRFDIVVTSKLKSKVAPIDGKNVNSIVASYKSENKKSIM